MGNKSIKRDLVVLQKIYEHQKILKEEFVKYKIVDANDFDSQHIGYMVRRGFVQTVGDVFELSRSLKDETIKKIGFNKRIIKDFRNTATHNYGSLNNLIIFSCVKHCISKELMKNVNDEILRLETELSENNNDKNNNI